MKGHTSKSGNPIISLNSIFLSPSSSLLGEEGKISGKVAGSTIPLYALASKPFSIVPGGWSGLNIPDASFPAAL